MRCEESGGHGSQSRIRVEQLHPRSNPTGIDRPEGCFQEEYITTDIIVYVLLLMSHGQHATHPLFSL